MTDIHIHDCMAVQYYTQQKSDCKWRRGEWDYEVRREESEGREKQSKNVNETFRARFGQRVAENTERNYT